MKIKYMNFYILILKNYIMKFEDVDKNYNLNLYYNFFFDLLFRC